MHNLKSTLHHQKLILLEKHFTYKHIVFQSLLIPKYLKGLDVLCMMECLYTVCIIMFLGISIEGEKMAFCQKL